MSTELEPQAFRLAIGQARVLVITLDATPEEDVSGWDVGFYVRRKGNLVLTKLTGDGITCTDGTTGEWEVLINEEDTTYDVANAPATTINGKQGLCDWAFWRTDDGSETPLAYGTIDVFRTALTG